MAQIMYVMVKTVFKHLFYQGHSGFLIIMVDMKIPVKSFAAITMS